MICSICGQEVERLCKNKCKKCYGREYRKLHHDRLLAEKKKWRKENKEQQQANERRWYENNLQRHKKSSFKAKLKKEYGITPQDYEIMNKQQNSCCAICGCSRDQNVQGKRLAVDHNHKTGMIRGLLCDKCNRGLGYFKDNIEALKKAIIYLSKKR